MLGYKIVCTEPGKAEFQQFQVREPRADEALVKIHYTLISNGTERARMIAMPNTHETFPYIPGYSGVGIVEKIGDKVTSLAVGDRVFVSHGGHASYNIKKPSAIVKIPDEVPFSDAVFCKMASFSMHGMRNCHFEMGESVVIIGLGNLGLLGVQLAKIAGALPVVAIGNRPIRREIAKKFGADYVFAPDDPDLVNKVIQATCITGRGADVVIDTSGSVDALQPAVKYMARYGRLSLVGCNRVTDKPIDLYQFHLKGISIIGSNASTQKNHESCPGIWTGRRNFNTILGYMAQKKLTPSLMEPVVVSPYQATDIYSRLINDREFPLGVVFDWTQY